MQNWGFGYGRDMTILAGDIGGTNTRLALFYNDEILIEQKFLSQKYKSLEEIIQEFLVDKKAKIVRAAFGVAGPVLEGRCHATNLPWVIESSHLASHLGLPSVFLLNDLEAKAYGISVLKESELFMLQSGKTDQKGNRSLIAAGTGLGEAGLFWDGMVHHPFASEGGHTDFAPRDDLEVELLGYLIKKFSHVSYERIVSGPGIYLLYRFLVEKGKEKESEVIRKELEKGDPPKEIAKWAREGDPVCLRALQWFFSLYGAEAGNMALKFLSLGGVYIGGGIAPHWAREMREGPFLSSFLSKGRFRPLLESIPVFVILNDNASLLGCAYVAKRSQNNNF